MSLEEFKHLVDFDFAEHFGIITHTVKLDNSNWKTNEILNDISQGFGTIKCKFCEKNAAIIKTDDRICYCEEHYEDLKLSSKEVAKIERITNEFKDRVEKMYKYLIFVQERIHFIKLDRFKALIVKKKADIDGLKDKLGLKINNFHTTIQTLKKSRDLELLFNAKSSFDDIKKIACDIVDEIYDLLKGKFKESFCKSINNECDVNYLNDYQYEETKGEKLLHQPEDNIYEKPLDFFVGDFISSLKVFNFQDEIKGLFKYSVKMTNSFEECKKELNKVQNELDSIKEESKIDKTNEENKLVSNKEIENAIKNYEIYCQLKLKIETCMSIKNNEKSLPNLLNQILKEAETYQSEHTKLIQLIIELLRSYKNPTTSNLFSDKTVEYIRKILVDFLFRFKDKHPFSKPKERKVMDVFNIVMDFMYEHGLEPSESLKEEYRECETNKRLTTFPEYEYLNSLYEKGFDKEKYDFMKMRFESRPPFVYYFNPDIQLEEKFGINIDGYRFYNIGFISKGTIIRIGAAFYLNETGVINQGYFKDNKLYNYGREIWQSGDNYEGGYNMDKLHGKGEYEFYEYGKRIVGQYVNDKKEGEFKCYDKEGNMTIVHFKDGKRVEE